MNRRDFLKQTAGSVAAALGSMAAQSASAPNQTNDNLTFVLEFIRELQATERIRSLGEQELKEKGVDKIAVSIRNSTRVQLELGSSVRILNRVRLKPPIDFLPQSIIDTYRQKIELHQLMIDICSQLLAGPYPGVDYGKLAAEMPKITASLEFVDETIFKTTPAVFATLIDTKEDIEGHINHLVITKAERQRLIQNLKDSFGSKLTADRQNYTVSTASVLLSMLQKNFKCSDEPW